MTNDEIDTVVASMDFNKDGVPDVEIKDTNGHTVYINVKWLIGAAATLVTSVVAYATVVL